MIIIGVDPGCSGALVMLDAVGKYISHLEMPTIKVGTKTRVNGAAIAGWIRSELELQAYHHMSLVHAFIEQVGAMPKQGTASMFTFGHAVGTVQGVMAGAGIACTQITPQAWKKSAGLIGSDKDAARSRAIMLYPELRALDAIGKGQALADALLIARHGRIQMNNKEDLL